MSSFNHLKIKIGVSEHKNLQNTIQKVGEMSNFSLGLKGKLIGKALINESLLICIRCCQKNVKGNVFNIVDEKKWGSTSSHLTAKLIPPPPPTAYTNGANLFLNSC